MKKGDVVWETEREEIEEEGKREGVVRGKIFQVHYSTVNTTKLSEYGHSKICTIPLVQKKCS